MDKTVLPEFQEFLRSRKFVADKNIIYYAYWVSGFIKFSNKYEHLEKGLLAEKYIDGLKNGKNIEDWQVRQAEIALNIYTKHYMGEKNSTNSSDRSKLFADSSKLLQILREAIRIKHYSYSTERTYMDWARRFHTYLSNVKKKNINAESVDSEDVSPTSAVMGL